MRDITIMSNLGQAHWDYGKGPRNTDGHAHMHTIREEDYPVDSQPTSAEEDAEWELVREEADEECEWELVPKD